MTSDARKLAEAFFRGYAARSGRSVRWLREQGLNVYKCECGDEECIGYAIMSPEGAAHDRTVSDIE